MKVMEIGPDVAGRLPEAAGRWLGPDAEAFPASVMPSLRLRAAEACADDARGSRFGDLPLLEKGMKWPTTLEGMPLSFLCQVHTDDVLRHLDGSGLPPDTLLTFFYEANQADATWDHLIDPEDAQYWRVLAVDPSAAQAVPEPSYDSDDAFTWDGQTMTFERVLTVPDQEEAFTAGLWRATDRVNGRSITERLRGVEGLYDEIRPEPDFWHRMFGWPELKQDGATNNSVRLLLQLDNGSDPGYDWPGSATLHYWISATDLKAHNFTRTWAFLAGT